LHRIKLPSVNVDPGTTPPIIRMQAGKLRASKPQPNASIMQSDAVV
jgi:hypothetical protein